MCSPGPSVSPQRGITRLPGRATALFGHRGDNSSGQLGNGSTTSDTTANPTPTQVTALSLTTLLGDINGDGTINVTDALEALQYAVKLNPLPSLTTAEVLARGNMTGTDTTILTVQDAQIILQIAVKLIP